MNILFGMIWNVYNAHQSFEPGIERLLGAMGGRTAGASTERRGGGYDRGGMLGILRPSDDRDPCGHAAYNPVAMVCSDSGGQKLQAVETRLSKSAYVKASKAFAARAQVSHVGLTSPRRSVTSQTSLRRSY